MGLKSVWKIPTRKWNALAFKHFNRLIAASKAKKNLDKKRINRALGLVLADAPNKYHTTVQECDCPDAANRVGMVCKHRLKVWMETKIIDEWTR